MPILALCHDRYNDLTNTETAMLTGFALAFIGTWAIIVRAFV